MKKLWIVCSLLALMLTATALPVTLADDPVDGRAGRAEVRFLQGMIDHHQMALDMAVDCLDKASTESVVTLCQNVIDAQSAEIEMMQGWLLDWYNIAYSSMSMLEMLELMDMMDDDMGGMDHGSMGMMDDGPYTDPPMMMGMFAGFNRLEGVDYEIAWLESMIDHHDDALHMAERLLRRVPEDAGHAELLELARQIVADQTAEIDEMEQLIAELSA
jgi:uncharacterized protein (DUF305 family)